MLRRGRGIFRPTKTIALSRNVILAITYRLICVRPHISRLCELYRDWVKHLDVVLRHEYRAGEKLFIDYAGDKIPIYDRQTGEVDFQASLFVAVLGASSYTFAQATRSQDLSCWIDSHVCALEFFV